eukprot:scaffold152498_cov17-Tisochrysis_lutea.AAC.1
MSYRKNWGQYDPVPTTDKDIVSVSGLQGRPARRTRPRTSEYKIWVQCIIHPVCVLHTPVDTLAHTHLHCLEILFAMGLGKQISMYWKPTPCLNANKSLNVAITWPRGVRQGTMRPAVLHTILTSSLSSILGIHLTELHLSAHAHSHNSRKVAESVANFHHKRMLLRAYEK